MVASILKLSAACLICASLLSSAPIEAAVAAQPEQSTIIRLLPGTVEVTPGMQAGVVAALAGANAAFGRSAYFAITDVRQEGDWALVSVLGLAQVHAESKWSIEDGTWSGLVLLRAGAGGAWHGATRRAQGFNSLLAEAPESFLGSKAKRDLSMIPAASAETTSSYVFPWQSNTSMSYGYLGVHTNGFSFGSYVGWVAVDMASDGDTSLGHAPNRLLAADAGTIAYKCTDANNVAVQLGSFFYTHLSDNANLYVGNSFPQGGELGQMKVGSFGSTGSGCGWASQPAGWFHVHWGFPDSDLQVEDWTLSVSTQNWTNGATTVAPGDGWIKAHGIPGDDIDTPLDLTGSPFSDARDTTLMSSASDDPVPGVCGLAAGLASVWYRYVPAASGPITVDTFASNYDTYLAAWKGTRGSLSPVACNNDAGNTLQSRLWFNAGLGTTYYVEVAQVNSAASDPVTTAGGGTLHLHAHLGMQPAADFDGNGTTDISVFRPSTNGWFVQNQSSAVFGLSGDIPVSGDYDGNGTADIAVFRPSNASWYVKDQSAGFFGLPGDVPMPGDYDGNCTTDLAVYRPSTSAWYVRNQLATVFGLPGDIPVPGDYNGDGTTDIAVYRPSTSGWYIKNQLSTIYGLAGDIPVPADYDGNGTSDIAVFRPSTSGWYVRGQSSMIYGMPGDIPVPGDYNADGKADIAVFRNNGSWYVNNQFSLFFGTTGDFPLPVRDTNGDGDPYQ